MIDKIYIDTVGEMVRIDATHNEKQGTQRMTTTSYITATNIKNLPAGDAGERVYFTEECYSDSHVWVQVKRTAKTATLARVECLRDPAFKPEYIAGGYAGHCTNQREQTWIYAGDGSDSDYHRTVRHTKKGWAHKGTPYIENRAHEFYDYNF
jgi:hypothetical protein